MENMQPLRRKSQLTTGATILHPEHPENKATILGFENRKTCYGTHKALVIRIYNGREEKHHVNNFMKGARSEGLEICQA